MNTFLPVGLVVCLVAGAALWWWPGDEATVEAAAVPKDTTPPTPAEVPVLNARWIAPPAVQNPKSEEKRHMVKLPTGEWLRALNGAVDVKPMEWPADRPFSPIIGVERSPSGKDWWVHADGTKSTTEMIFRSDLGRHDAILEIASPTPALPMESPEGEQPKGKPDGGSAPRSGGAEVGSNSSEIKKR